jgi:hypothetical protein
MQRVCPKWKRQKCRGRKNAALLIRLRHRRRAELTLYRRFETRAAQTIGEALLEAGPRIGVEDDLVAPAARPAAPELDSAALAGFRERRHRAAVTHAFLAILLFPPRLFQGVEILWAGCAYPVGKMWSKKIVRAFRASPGARNGSAARFASFFACVSHRDP